MLMVLAAIKTQGGHNGFWVFFALKRNPAMRVAIGARLTSLILNQFQA
jgi:hypothetical protein